MPSTCYQNNRLGKGFFQISITDIFLYAMGVNLLPKTSTSVAFNATDVAEFSYRRMLSGLEVALEIQAHG